MIAPAPKLEFREMAWKDMANIELLRDAIFESLGYARIFIESALLHIQGGDDAGMLHSMKNASLHMAAAAESTNDLIRLRSAINDSHAGRLAKIEGSRESA